MSAGVGGLRVAQGVVGIIEESTAGTYVEPSVAFPAYDISVSFGGDNMERKETNTHFGKLKPIPGIGTCEIGFSIPVVGAGSAGTVPYYDAAMLACGFASSDYSALSKIRYKPATTFDDAASGGDPNTTNPALAKYSVSFWNDGVRYSARGCMGNVVFNAKAGEPMEWKFTFRGGYQAVVTDAPPTPTVSTLPLPRWLGATLSVNGDTLITETFTLDLGNVLSNRIDANDANGIKGVMITDRRPKLTVDPEMELIALQDFFGDWRAGTSFAVTWGTISGGAAGNIWAFSAGECVFNPPSLAEREGIRTLDLELDICNTTATEGGDFYFEIT